MTPFRNSFRFSIVSAAAWIVALTATFAEEESQPGEIRPFKIHVDDDVLDDLQRRLDRTRFPDTVPSSGWEYGVDIEYMTDLVKYWREDYNWRDHERRLNELDHYITAIDGLQLHFIHQRSPHKNATALILLHGWPGSFYEFHKIIGPLTEPEKHGGTASDVFHVVCPSLPGFGFSSKPKERGWSSRRMMEVMAKLMARLGYEQYGAHGGDWGRGIAVGLASNDGGHCIGAHCTYPPGGRPANDPLRGVTQQESHRMQKRREELRDHGGYGSIQRTRPLALAYGLNDSPAGLAAWIVDKFWAWSDHRGDLDNSFSKDELLTNIMIYWVTETMPSSVRIYYETAHGNPRPSSMTSFARSGPPSPLGFVLFPKEISMPPRAWVERQYGKRLIHWTEMPRGGHFASMEVPDLLVKDMRTFFRSLNDK